MGGVDVTEDRLKVQSQIGYMPENAPLYGEMLVQEYLQMMAELRSIPRGKRNEAITEAVIATGLQQRLVQPISCPRGTDSVLGWRRPSFTNPKSGLGRTDQRFRPGSNR